MPLPWPTRLANWRRPPVRWPPRSQLTTRRQRPRGRAAPPSLGPRVGRILRTSLYTTIGLDCRVCAAPLIASQHKMFTPREGGHPTMRAGYDLKEKDMPQIIVTADREAAFGDGTVTLRERVNVS